MQSFAEETRKRFSVFPPLFLSADTRSLKLELKPYLQPFEQELAIRELRSLLQSNAKIVESDGYHIVQTDKPMEFFRDRLTYWQRVGKTVIEPTIQTTLEFAQNGMAQLKERASLHNARRLRYGPHDLHEYRGKFFPQLVRSLINISGISEAGIVLDPFCGSGTTPCEVLASGRSVVAVDLNPLSVLIARVKSTIVLEKPDTFKETICKYLNKFQFATTKEKVTWSERDVEYLLRWFNPKALDDISAILSEIQGVREPFYQDIFRVCLSNIIRSVSWQKDTDLRVRKEVKPYQVGKAIQLFQEEVQQQFERIHAYLCMLPRIKTKPSVNIYQGDAVKIDRLLSKHAGKIGLLITSPPYATALPYLDTDRLSLVILGLLPRTEHKDTEMYMVGTREISERKRQEAWENYQIRKGELPASVTKLIDQIADANHGNGIGFRRRNLPALLGKYFLDMLDSMRAAHSLMCPDAKAFYVVGNNSTIVIGKRIEIPTNEFLFEVGVAAGFKAEETIPMELLVSRDIFKFNRGTAESILCFRA